MDESESPSNDELKQALRAHYFEEKCDLLQFLAEKFGKDLDQTIDQYIFQSSYTFWQKLSESEENNSLEQYLHLLWDGYCANDGIQFSSLKEGQKIQYKVVRCPWAEIAREVGKSEWGYRFYCKTDYASVEGFNPKIRFSRSKTLMQGDDCCDHCYWVDEE